MTNSNALTLLKENINAQMKILLLLGGFTHIGFVFLALFLGVYPPAIFSSVAAILFIFAGCFIRLTNFLFFYILTFLEIIANVVFLEITVGSALGFPLYFFTLIPISTYILSCSYRKNYHLAFLICSFILNISAYIFFSHVLPNFSPDPVLTETASFCFYSFSAAGVGFMIGFLSLYFILNTLSQYTRVQEENSLLLETSHRDELTGLYNRRFMNDFLNKTFIGPKTEFCIGMSDIDFFKNFNDKYGHDAGDLILRTLPVLFAPFCEKENIIICRWGGEEFLFYFPFSPEKGQNLLNQIRKNIEKSVLSYGNEALRITMTFGLSQTDKNYSSVTEMIKAADDNLYEGKRRGRNCVVL